MAHIMIIDDDRQICRLLSERFTLDNHTVSHAQTLAEGLEKVFSGNCDIVFLDVKLPDGNGLEAIGTIQEHPDAPEVIIMTGQSCHEGAELAIKSKAWDYIPKPGSHKEFRFSLKQALEYRRQKQAVGLELKSCANKIIGNSRQIKASLKNVVHAARTETPVVITGETGTGKELFARAIHENSRRRTHDFIILDCGALPENLAESVLFGHTRGHSPGRIRIKPA